MTDDVKRWEVRVDIVDSSTGDYVFWEDYDALVKELARVREAARYVIKRLGDASTIESDMRQCREMLAKALGA